jgi:hypothetical protein
LARRTADATRTLAASLPEAEEQHSRPPAKAAALLFVEDGVSPSGEIDLVALIDAVEEGGRDPAGRPGGLAPSKHRYGDPVLAQSPGGIGR